MVQKSARLAIYFVNNNYYNEYGFLIFARCVLPDGKENLTHLAIYFVNNNHPDKY